MASVAIVSEAAASPVTLEDVDITHQLRLRTGSRENRHGEVAGLASLAQTVCQQPKAVLKQLARLGLELCDADSAGVSVIEQTDDGELFRWQALEGVVEPYEGGTTPREWSPCGACLRAGTATLYSHPERFFTYFLDLNKPLCEGLVIPMYRDGVAVATIWIITHSEGVHFDTEDVRLMTVLGDFAVRALYPESPALPSSRPVDGASLVWAEHIRRIARRDEFSLEMLIKDTRPLVQSIALRILGSRVDAEEVAADVYARVWGAADTFDLNRGSVAAWLTTIARTSAIDRLRKRSVRERCEAGTGSPLNRQQQVEAPAEASINALQTRKSLVRALETLPLEQRRAMELFYFSELSVTEISTVLGHPAGTVKTRLRLGLGKLRSLLATTALSAL